MTWLGVFYVTVAVGQVGVVVWVTRQVETIRGYRRDWQDLADTQLKHEVDIRYVRELVNPMARSGHAPLPKHLRQEH